ncbi:hypothetical protein EVAR_37108_1 [Eumeta japonica]|uniref:Uncharacterized protein n=1 Tax=Eumeta variegata TaxID=151549 RepID=A0A4C1XQ23_EUMVA|nr:hypothetical protein EVAR_37108_1 [Eumeta japonica]
MRRETSLSNAEQLAWPELTGHATAAHLLLFPERIKMYKRARESRERRRAEGVAPRRRDAVCRHGVTVDFTAKARQ